MTLQELRFFCIYLARINPLNVNSRNVRFPIAHFTNIIGLGKVNIIDMKRAINSLLSKMVIIADEQTGGFTAFQLFKEGVVNMDDSGEWYVEIDAHDKALPLMFEFKDKYFSYKLWNALRLRSPNQLRMYEILKQYEHIGYRVLGVEQLKLLLGMDISEYPRFGNFRTYVLDSCQRALAERTDIKFSYEPYGKRGKGGKIQFLRFTIEKNENHVEQMMLDQFLEQQAADIIRTPTTSERGESSFYDDRLAFLALACNHEFTLIEMSLLWDTMTAKLPFDIVTDDIRAHQHLQHKYAELCWRDDPKGKVRHRFNYLRSIVGLA